MHNMLSDHGRVRVPSLSRVWLFATPRTVARRLLCPWGFQGKNTGVGCHPLLQGSFPAQGSNPSLLYLLHWQADLLPLSHLEIPRPVSRRPDRTRPTSSMPESLLQKAVFFLIPWQTLFGLELQLFPEFPASLIRSWTHQASAISWANCLK